MKYRRDGAVFEIDVGFCIMSRLRRLSAVWNVFGYGCKMCGFGGNIRDRRLLRFGPSIG